MANQVQISVVVPCYNVEKYICQCLDSIVKQTLQNIEIICIDDGSKDHTGEILDEYMAKDKRIKVIHKENEGVHIARNMGIDLAQGEYTSPFLTPMIFLNWICWKKCIIKPSKKMLIFVFAVVHIIKMELILKDFTP